jgi:hypothetical protein
MKVNQIVGEHKKGVRAHKYTKKPVDHTVAHAKAKEKLQAIKPMEDMAPPQTANSQGTAGEGTIVASDEKSVTVQMPDGTQIKKDLLGGVTTDANGNPVFQAGANPQQSGTAPTQQTPQQKLAAGTKIAVNTQPQQQTMGSPATMEEELEQSNGKNTVDAIKKGLQLFASDGDPIEITSTRKEVDQQYIADPVNAGNRVGYVRFNGKTYLALNTGHKWKVGPTVFGEITGMYNLPGDTNKKYAPPQISPGQSRQGPPSFKGAQNLEESDKILLDKMLTIAGLR